MRGQIVEEHQHHPICCKCVPEQLFVLRMVIPLNLFQHLRDHHADLFASISTGSGASESNTKTQQTIESSLARSTKYPRGSPQAKELTRAITYYLAKDAMPIYTVEKAGFQHMIIVIIMKNLMMIIVSKIINNRPTLDNSKLLLTTLLKSALC